MEKYMEIYFFIEKEVTFSTNMLVPYVRNYPLPQ